MLICNDIIRKMMDLIYLIPNLRPLICPYDTSENITFNVVCNVAVCECKRPPNQDLPKKNNPLKPV